MKNMIALVAAVVLLSSSALAAGEIWMQGYTPAHTSVSPYDFAPPVALMWRFSSEEAKKATPQRQPAMLGPEAMMGMGGPPGMMPGGTSGGTKLPKPVASPVVASDRVFFAIGKTVYCVDRITGEQLWKRGMGANVYSTPVYANGYLYVAGDDGRIHAISANNGSEEWVYRLDKGVRAPLTYADGVLYIGCDDGRVYALDTNTQEVQWSYTTGSKVRAAPTLWRETVYVVNQAGRLFAISRRGRQRWSIALGERYCFAPPVVRSERIYVAAGTTLWAFDARLGHRRWKYESRALITGPVAVTGNSVIFGNREGAIYCLDAATGRVRWRYPEEGVVGRVQSGVCMAGNIVLARTGLMGVVALDASSGGLLWHYKLPEPPKRAKAAGQMPTGMQPGGMEMPGGPAGMPGEGEGAMPGMRRMPGMRMATTLKMEDLVDPSIALADNRLYVVGDDCVLYGLEADAPDSVPPIISDVVLEIQGEKKMRFAYAVPVDDPEQHPLRFADYVKVPGSPPVYISVKVVDLGCGVDPDSIEMTMDGKQLQTVYDADNGLLWFIHGAKGRGARALPNGKHNFVVQAMDWRGNLG
ncbi:MAG: PQQ-binding-like beta-propeller repeat protein, partial [Armatimonadetes bacterium]|nr:PQQ-binding-like beta-propeller repeat protein [Armatimonadota bacterium]